MPITCSRRLLTASSSNSNHYGGVARHGGPAHRFAVAAVSGSSTRGEGVKGVYHINAVDEVTQWQVVGATEQISEAYLVPVVCRALLLGQT